MLSSYLYPLPKHTVDIKDSGLCFTVICPNLRIVTMHCAQAHTVPEDRCTSVHQRQRVNIILECASHGHMYAPRQQALFWPRADVSLVPATVSLHQLEWIASLNPPPQGTAGLPGCQAAGRVLRGEREGAALGNGPGADPMEKLRKHISGL